jgi:hypothetical protein
MTTYLGIKAATLSLRPKWQQQENERAQDLLKKVRE